MEGEREPQGALRTELWARTRKEGDAFVDRSKNSTVFPGQRMGQGEAAVRGRSKIMGSFLSCRKGAGFCAEHWEVTGKFSAGHGVISVLFSKVHPS